MSTTCHLWLRNTLCALRWITLIVVFLLGAPRASPAHAIPTDLFFSEYAEGSSYNKALEIFNGTGAAINLATENYDVQIFFNGKTTAGATIPLTGNLAANDVHVLADARANDPLLLTQIDQTYSGSFFNGDDAIALRKNGIIIDVIGQIGHDPGSQWGSGDTSTQNNTLRRKATIQTGDPNGNDSFDPAAEWGGFPQDNFDNLGQHTLAATTPTVSQTTPGNGASDVAVDTTISIDFSQPVTVAGDWFQITCDKSGTHTPSNTAVSGGPQNWQITPNNNFSHGESCTVTLFATQITDQNNTPMSADYIWQFTTAAPSSGWIINEIHADPDRNDGDANGDGTVSSTQDEFVEIINNTGQEADISGWTLTDNNSVRHTFPSGTVMPNQCALVLFSGGTAVGDFGNALIQFAGSLGLNNSGDTLTLSDGTKTQAVYAYGNEGNDNQSLTRNPDITGPNPLVKHTTVTGANGARFSPGTQANGSAFSPCAQPNTPPGINTTTPANQDVDILLDASITLQFSEAVSVTADAFNLECPAGTTHPFTVSPAPPGNTAEFTLTPTSSYSYSTTCTVTVLANQITDQHQPPASMSADHAFSFTTIDPPPPPDPILISEFLYDGLTPVTEGDEFAEVCNPNSGPVDLTNYKIGDEETENGGEGMYQFPSGTILPVDGCLVIAKNGTDFNNRFNASPDFEIIDSSPAIPNVNKYSAWSSGDWALSNTGDELVVLGPNNEILDSIAYRNGDYNGLHLEPDASAPYPNSLQRVWPGDTNWMSNDFVRTTPTPGNPTIPPSPNVPPPASLPEGMNAYWGDLHAHTSFSDGAGPPHYALAKARGAGLHFLSISDHGNWLSLREWRNTLTQTHAATLDNSFVALRGVEWTHRTEGHINIFNHDTLLSRDVPQFDSLVKIYNWLENNPTAIAQFDHPGINYDGSFDSFAFKANTTPFIHLQEIGNHAREYVTYESAFIQSNMLGWKTAPTNNSDTHAADWGSRASMRTGIVAPALTETDLLAAIRARRVFATEDSNLALALRLDDAWMGSTLTTTGPISITVNFVDTDPEPMTLILYDGNLPLVNTEFNTSTGQWSTSVTVLPGHFYWAKAVQADGDTAYSAPVWIEGIAPPDTLYINEILPAPIDWDWDGNGTPDHTDEWIEIYNPLNRPIGLGGWRLTDASKKIYNIPLDTVIPAGGFATFYQSQTEFSLNNDSDTVSLIHPNGNIIDTFSYDDSPGYDETWCRLSDGSPYWSDNCAPSPDAANQEQKAPAPLKVSIFEAKHLTPDAWVRVKGQVTAPPGLLGDRTMYIQDKTSGIMVYLPKEYSSHCGEGHHVEVVGYLKEYHQEFEIKVVDKNDFKCGKADDPLPPLPIATTSMLDAYEGMLVMLSGQAAGFKGRSTLWIDDGTDRAKLYIRQRTGIKKPFIEIGTPIRAVGIVSQYSNDNSPTRDDYRLLLRYQNDLILPMPATVPANWPTLLPETGY